MSPEADAGAEAPHPPPPAAARRPRRSWWLLGAVAALALGGFLLLHKAAPLDVEGRRAELVAGALERVQDRLAEGLARASRALREIEPAIARAGEDRILRFEALERIRAATDVQGIECSIPSEPPLWAGTPFDTNGSNEARPAWEGSFDSGEQGDVHYHAGPFVRILQVDGPKSGPLQSYVTVALEDAAPAASSFGSTLEERWADAMHVRRISILPPAVLERPAEPGVARATVVGPDGRPRLVVEVEPPSEDTVTSLLQEEGRRTRGWLGLAGLLLASVSAAAGVRRYVPDGARRALAFGALGLLVRQGLHTLSLRERFSGWAPAFRSSDFGVPGWYGWLSNPGELFLTCLAVLGAALALARALRQVEPRPTAVPCGLTALGGVALVLGGVRLWLELVATVIANSFDRQIDFFAAGALFPTLPRALLLSALVAGTATAWVLCRAGLRIAILAVCRMPPALAAALAGAAGGLLAWATAPASTPAWAPFLLPASAAFVGRLAPGEARLGTPSRILLVSVLSTLLLFPMLWRGTQQAALEDMKTRVHELVSRNDSDRANLVAKLSKLAEDARLVEELARIERQRVPGGGGGPPEGVALYAWKQLQLATSGDDEDLVSLYDPQGHRIERFGVNTPPLRRLPDPGPDRARDGEGVTIVSVPWDEKHVAATIGRVRIRGADGALVGTVAVTVPDALTVRLFGLSPRLAPGRPMGQEDAARSRPLEMRLVSNGRVVLATDPDAPKRLPPTFDPATLSGEGFVPAGPDGGEPWFAVEAGDRGIVLARGPALDYQVGLYAIARMVLTGVGLGAILALLTLLLSIRRFRPRLQDKILLSYFVVSVVPLVVLAYANFRDLQRRTERDFTERQAVVARSLRDEIESSVGDNLGELSTTLRPYAEARGQDVVLYIGGNETATSLPSLVDAELLPARLDASVYRATELEGRDLRVREETLGGRKVQVAYTALRDAYGHPYATLSVPQFFDAERAAQRAAETGSVLLAAYLLTLVVVVVLGIYVSRGLARPLRQLSDAVRRVAAGHLDVSIPGTGRDEIGRLVRGFNEMTADLQKAREQAAKAERETAWRSMARQVAHEIKNPLTPMKLMLQQLQATAKAEPGRLGELIEPTVRVTLEQIDALSRIASDFAAFARFPPRALADVPVNEVLRSVATLYGGAEAQVVTDLADGLPPVRWDRDELRRVFVNLVANAVQAKDDGKGRVLVTVRSSRAKVPATGRDGVLVTVTDDGVGIAPEHRARLFEPDFSTKTHGTGLGLAIVKRIVADLSGDLRIDSTPGRGTTVSTWLPAADGVGVPPSP